MREIKFRAWDKTKKEMLMPEKQEFIVVSSNPFGAVRYTDVESACGSESQFCWADADLIDGRYELLQYTGLQDKNGVDIYDGDIIRHPRHSRPFSKKAKHALVDCVVYWDSGDHTKVELNPSKAGNPSLCNDNPSFRAKVINADGDERFWGYNWSEFHDCEVIGNIYENPDLLEESNARS